MNFLYKLFFLELLHDLLFTNNTLFISTFKVFSRSKVFLFAKVVLLFTERLKVRCNFFFLKAAF